MRLGAPVFAKTGSPDDWARSVRQAGYGAAYCPRLSVDDEDTIRAYGDAARRADVVIAEVGAWSDPLCLDEDKRQEAIAYCQGQLALAERIEARCCVNTAGSRVADWRGPHPVNLSDDTFDLIVQTTRTIIDAVKPTRTYYTLETMPWVFPDSIASYERLIRSIDRAGFAVHFDPVNLICSPQRFCRNGELIREFIQALGSRIRSCHAKDVAAEPRLTVHLNETMPGRGALDYAVYLQELAQLDPDTPLMIEHLQTAEEYEQAARHIRPVADRVGVVFG